MYSAANRASCYVLADLRLFCWRFMPVRRSAAYGSTWARQPGISRTRLTPTGFPTAIDRSPTRAEADRPNVWASPVCIRGVSTFDEERSEGNSKVRAGHPEPARSR